ncbi:MAG: peptidase M28 family protein, partial [Flavobacteriaceae bacterium]|nr:peptidase M28 family protein [Flavobacteriaceae bacterium]
MRYFIIVTFCFFGFISSAQSDADYIKEIYKNALTDGHSYEWLDYLSNEIGGRLSGSLNAEYAVEYTKSELKKLGLDRVWLQPVMVPKWVRGNPEFGYIETSPGKT